MPRIILYIAILIGIEALLVTVIVSPRYLEKSLRNELTQGQLVFGDAFITGAMFDAYESYIKTAKRTGISGELRKLTTTTEAQRTKGGAMEKVGDGILPWAAARARALLLAWYAALYRLEVLVGVLPYILPVLIPTVFDGIVTNKIRQASFQQSMATVYNGAKMALVLSLFAPVIFALSPFSVDPRILIGYVFWLPAVVWVVTVNVQHRF